MLPNRNNSNDIGDRSGDNDNYWIVPFYDRRREIMPLLPIYCMFLDG